VQHLVHLLRVEEEVVAAGLGLEEAVAVGMPDHLALHEARAVGHQQVAAAVAHHLPVTLHRGEAPLVAFLLLGRDAEALAQRVVGQRAVT
jgi:hypothetical protein